MWGKINNFQFSLAQIVRNIQYTIFKLSVGDDDVD